MKYTPNQYAAALCDALEVLPEAKHDGALSRFISLIRENGDDVRLHDIVASVQSELVRRRGGREITLTFARTPEQRMVERIKGAFASESDAIRVAVQPDAIAGVRVTVNNEQEMDATFKGRLQTVFASHS